MLYNLKNVNRVNFTFCMIQITNNKLLITQIKSYSLIVLIFTLLAGCSAKDEEPGRLENVTIALVKLEGTALVRIALNNGYFKKEGLDITLNEYDLDSDALEAVLNGNADIATAGKTPIVKKSFQRQDFVIVGTIYSSDSGVKIVSRRGRGIETPSDLFGKKIGIPKWSEEHLFLDVLLVNHGLTLSDVKLVYDEPQILIKSMEKGEIDACSLREPYAFQARLKLKDNAVVFSGDGIYSTTINLVTLTEYAEGHPLILKRIYRALLRAEEFIRKNKYASIRIIAEELKLEEKYLEDIFGESSYLLRLEQNLLFTLENEARWMIINNLTEKRRSPNYLKYVYKEGLKEVKPEAVTIIH